MTLEERIDELVDQLNAASVAYYGGGKEIMTDFEWDKAFDQLSILEEETGYIRDDSPTLTKDHSRIPSIVSSKDQVGVRPSKVGSELSYMDILEA